ncbi:hypothetical protein JW977_03000 [Candidatus Falkowbacteria bacterium]|nr:hypothetical protein [Candidatus Falkowbacteria bacterium]
MSEMQGGKMLKAVSLKSQTKIGILKKGETKCPFCGDQIYYHHATEEKDAEGRQIIVCTGCYNKYVEV